MKARFLLSAILCLALAAGISGCTTSVSSDDSKPTSESSSTDSEESTAEEEEPEEPTAKPISVGEEVQSDDFSITLTSARVDSVLQSDASSTYWTPQDGGAFVILEFDVTALNSNQLPVDDYAITDLAANYDGDSYQGWNLKYIASQLWISFMHTYLDANLPVHVYAYTTVPSSALDGGTLSVDMTLADTPYTVTIQ